MLPINHLCIAVIYLAASLFNYLRRSLRSCTENCAQVGFVKLIMWNIILWLLRMVLLNDFIVRVLYGHSAWLTKIERMKWTKYVCCDLSALPHCPVKERFHINLATAIVRKAVFIYLFLISHVLAFSLMLTDFLVYVFSMYLSFIALSVLCLERIRRKSAF